MILPTCRNLIEFLDDYVEHRLAMPKRLAFEAHLTVCRDCRNYLSSYRQTIRLTNGLKEAGEASPMPEEMVKAILDVINRGGDESTDPTP
jgi:anti-sigma factor RsiW